MSYPIGTKYTSGGKVKRESTIIDIWTTFSSTGAIVQTRYVSSHMFMGQAVVERDVVAVTIARGLISTP